MKKSYYSAVLILILVFLLPSSGLRAQEMIKRIDKSFKINRDTKINISNKFGDMVVKIWDKDVVDIKVEIEARGRNESRTQKILDAIEVNFTDRISTGLLSVKTDVGNTGNNASFSINYEISMPDDNPLTLSNHFGNVFIGSYRGDLNLEVKYGQLMAEDLADADLEVAFSPSRSEIETLSAGELHLSYSKMTIDEVGDVKVDSRFSDLEIEQAKAIDLEARYGNIEIGTIGSLDAELQFADIDIDRLEESIILDARHGGGIKIDDISKNFRKIDIESKFNTIRLNLEHGAAAKLAFDLEFGNLKVNGDNVTFNKVIKETNSSVYRGYLVNPQATSSIRVVTQYGNIRLDVD